MPYRYPLLMTHKDVCYANEWGWCTWQIKCYVHTEAPSSSLVNITICRIYTNFLDLNEEWNSCYHSTEPRDQDRYRFRDAISLFFPTISDWTFLYHYLNIQTLNMDVKSNSPSLLFVYVSVLYLLFMHTNMSKLANQTSELGAGRSRSSMLGKQ